ncbi:hypothetical protein [Curtobacterium sp. 9128]|uniref:hypothetical protein n=1 Tax=Curtobacterium sp. 9128 TaxID=1793722 RepID=UPI0011A78839|nr:hypothetical protein [Curtobacterium sp. 9128]
MTAHAAVRWTETADGRWVGSSGPELVGVVSWHHGYAVRSADGAVRGQHSTLDSAKAQLEGWVRWIDSVQG